MKHVDRARITRRLVTVFGTDVPRNAHELDISIEQAEGLVSVGFLERVEIPQPAHRKNDPYSIEEADEPLFRAADPFAIFHSNLRMMAVGKEFLMADLSLEDVFQAFQTLSKSDDGNGNTVMFTFPRRPVDRSVWVASLMRGILQSTESDYTLRDML